MMWDTTKVIISISPLKPIAQGVSLLIVSHMKSNKLTQCAFISLIALAGILLGCDEKTKELGVIESYNQSILTDVPESVNVNDHFYVQITTFGDPCYECGPTELIRKGELAVEIIPYDYFTHGKDCPSVPKYMVHTATLNFAVPGTATVSFRGISEPSGNEVIRKRSIKVL